MKQRNGVLGLDTAKQVMLSFLILSVTGVAIILGLTALQTGISSTIDTTTLGLGVTNESFSGVAQGGWINATGYNLRTFNSSNTGYTILTAFNQSSGLLIPVSNYTVNDTGFVRNTTSVVPFDNWSNVTFTYNYITSYNNQRTNNIVGNVSGGLVTFFGSTGTIFSILVVVVIILAISIIIWAVGRFGQQTETSDVNL